MCPCLDSKPLCLKYKDTKEMETKLWLYFLELDEEIHINLSVPCPCNNRSEKHFLNFSVLSGQV